MYHSISMKRLQSPGQTPRPYQVYDNMIWADIPCPTQARTLVKSGLLQIHICSQIRYFTMITWDHQWLKEGGRGHLTFGDRHLHARNKGCQALKDKAEPRRCTHKILRHWKRKCICTGGKNEEAETWLCHTPACDENGNTRKLSGSMKGGGKGDKSGEQTCQGEHPCVQQPLTKL